MQVSRETLRRWTVDAGLWLSRRQRGTFHRAHNPLWQHGFSIRLRTVSHGNLSAFESLGKVAAVLPAADQEKIMTEDEAAATRARAYAIWETRGRPDGEHQSHWEQALKELGLTRPIDQPEGTTTQNSAASSKRRRTN